MLIFNLRLIWSNLWIVSMIMFVLCHHDQSLIFTWSVFTSTCIEPKCPQWTLLYCPYLSSRGNRNINVTLWWYPAGLCEVRCEILWFILYIMVIYIRLWLSLFLTSDKQAQSCEVTLVEKQGLLWDFVEFSRDMTQLAVP